MSVQVIVAKKVRRTDGMIEQQNSASDTVGGSSACTVANVSTKTSEFFSSSSDPYRQLALAANSTANFNNKEMMQQHINSSRYRKLEALIYEPILRHDQQPCCSKSRYDLKQCSIYIDMQLNAKRVLENEWLFKLARLEDESAGAQILLQCDRTHKTIESHFEWCVQQRLQTLKRQKKRLKTTTSLAGEVTMGELLESVNCIHFVLNAPDSFKRSFTETLANRRKVATPRSTKNSSNLITLPLAPQVSPSTSMRIAVIPASRYSEKPRVIVPRNERVNGDQILNQNVFHNLASDSHDRSAEKLLSEASKVAEETNESGVAVENPIVIEDDDVTDDQHSTVTSASLHGNQLVRNDKRCESAIHTEVSTVDGSKATKRRLELEPVFADWVPVSESPPAPCRRCYVALKRIPHSFLENDDGSAKQAEPLLAIGDNSVTHKFSWLTLQSRPCRADLNGNSESSINSEVTNESYQSLPLPVTQKVKTDVDWHSDVWNFSSSSSSSSCSFSSDKGSKGNLKRANGDSAVSSSDSKRFKASQTKPEAKAKSKASRADRFNIVPSKIRLRSSQGSSTRSSLLLNSISSSSSTSSISYVLGASRAK